MLVPKLLLTPIKIRIFGPKTAKFGPKSAIFGHFGPNIAIFCTFCPMPDQKPMWTRCLGRFSVMWVTKLLISPVKKRIFCPKTTKFGPKLAFFVNLGQAMHAGLFGALLVGRLVVVARGQYLARHLFTLSLIHKTIKHFVDLREGIRFKDNPVVLANFDSLQLHFKEKKTTTTSTRRRWKSC